MAENERIVQAASDGITFTATATVSSRHYMATTHLWTARRSAQLCKEREESTTDAKAGDVEHRSYAITAVLSSVAFLEGLVNEVLGDVADTPPGDTNPRTEGIPSSACAMIRTLWVESKLESKLQLLEKYQLALACAGQPRLELGEEPFQSASLLVRLRNALVHFKPEWQEHEEPHKFKSQLKGRFEDSQLGGDPWYPNKCLGAGCASWACDTATALADEWWQRMGIVRDYSGDFEVWPSP